MWKLPTKPMDSIIGTARHAGAAVVWYLECRRVEDAEDPAKPVERTAQSKGSAVLIRLERLQRDATGVRWIPHEPPHIERFLLTCAHVVHDALAESGVFDEIIAWAPGQDYRRWPQQAGPRPLGGSQPDLGGLRVYATEWGHVPCEGGVLDQARASRDWVLLRFDNARPAYVDSLPVVDGAATLDQGVYDVTICGYPGGSAGWPNNHLVQPMRVGGFRVERRDDEQGHIVLAGADEARPGMSGGGVFLADGTLLGLHRASLDAAMERHSVAAEGIFAWLAERGWRPLPGPVHRTRFWPWVVAFVLAVAAAAWLAVELHIERQRNEDAREKQKAEAEASERLNASSQECAGEDALRSGFPALKSTRWDNGKVLKIAFLDGDESRRGEFRGAVNEWLKYVNLSVSYSSAEQSDIRVSFVGAANYGYVGPKAADAAKSEPTLVLGALSTDADDRRAVILHEFGHTLGFMHEFQTINGNKFLNWAAIYEELAKPPSSWDKHTIDFNMRVPCVIDPIYSNKPFDPNSVMMFKFPSNWLSPPTRIELHGELSEGDIELARLAYPGRN
jgi:serralysin